MKKLAPLLVLVLGLAACASEPPPPAPMQLDYSALGKVYLDTQDMRVINRAGSTPQRAPYVGHMFQPKLSDAVNRWVTDRLQAVGQTGHATVIIKDASVTERPLTLGRGIENWFTRQQGSEYTGRIEVDIEAQSPVDNASAFARAQAVHKITLPEDATATEKYDAYNSLLNALMRDLNKGLEQSIRQHMRRFIVTEPADGTTPYPAPEINPLSILPAPMSGVP